VIERKANLAQRADSWLGRLYNRAIGWFCLLVGGAVILVTASGDDFAYATHWPFLAFGGLFLLLGRFSLRTKASLLETLAETPVRPPRRRD
jgi:hypothetical protein